MTTVNLRRLIFGYRIITLKEENIDSALNLLLKLNISAVLQSGGRLALSVKETEDFLCAGGEKYIECVSETLGAFGFLLRARWRVGSVLASVLVCLLFFLSGDLVFDVRVECDDLTFSESEAVGILEECGLYVGARWSAIDKNEIELSFLSRCERAGWITLNRRGTVAYVEILAARGSPSEDGGEREYSNIIADRDCVIKSVSVSCGSAMVKPGDVVVKGQILVSGIYEADGEVIFSHAEGTVIGESSEEVTVFVPYQETVKVYKGHRVVESYINIFNFSLNIFKSYGNYSALCDIIKEKEPFVAFDRVRLPFGITRIYADEYEESEVTYTEEEMVSLASSRMKRALVASLCAKDLLKISTEGEFQRGGYRMTSTLVYETEVGMDRIIEFEKQET